MVHLVVVLQVSREEGFPLGQAHTCRSQDQSCKALLLDLLAFPLVGVPYHLPLDHPKPKKVERVINNANRTKIVYNLIMDLHSWKSSNINNSGYNNNGTITIAKNVNKNNYTHADGVATTSYKNSSNDTNHNHDHNNSRSVDNVTVAHGKPVSSTVYSDHHYQPPTTHQKVRKVNCV